MHNGRMWDRSVLIRQAMYSGRDREAASKTALINARYAQFLAGSLIVSDRSQPAGFWDVEGFWKHPVEPFVWRG
jgi:hypothetical protein